MNSIAFWASILVVTFFATLAGLYWFLTVYFGLSVEGTLILIIPTFLLGGLACIYGFYYSVQRRFLGSDQSTSWPGFASAFRINVFGLLLVIPVALSLYFLLVHKDIALTMLFAIIAAAVSLWVIPKLARDWFQGRH